MAAIKAKDMRKLTKEQASQKLTELGNVLIQLEGEGKREKKKTVRKGIARLKTYLGELERKEKVKAA